MQVPKPTPIYRIMHVANLHVCLKRGGIHAPNFAPNNGLTYTTIHNLEIQTQRRVLHVPCGPGGVIHDYVAFYFGPRSPMLYQLHTGFVNGYREGQEPIIYLVSTAQAVKEAGFPYVFSDGHGIANFTAWYEDLEHLSQIDWHTVYAKIWKDTVQDMDRQRRKQAEFLIHQFCDWSLIQKIAVVNSEMKTKVEEILSRFPSSMRRDVEVQSSWYY